MAGRVTVAQRPRLPGRALTIGAAGAMLVLALVGCSSGERPRPARSPQQLLAARDAADQQVADVHESIVARYLARVKSHQDDFAAGRSTSPAVVNELILSGGGDWCAFGAGFLKGWGAVPPGPMARPHFDGVTGVSTGALIAPFAF